MLEKMKEIWRKWFGKKSVSVLESSSPKEDVQASECSSHTSNLCQERNLKKQKNSSLLDDLEACLFSRYDFRFNVLTEHTEYAPKGSSDYELVDQRVLNTLCLVARRNGINCWDKDVSRLLLSQEIPDFHPFLHYVANLPEWDGSDRVSELARRVSDEELWVNGFHRWMLAMTSQWMGMDAQCANAVAPLLVSTEQGRCKSTFCSILLPEELQKFYIDKFDITSVSGCEQKLSLFGLVNMDEFDRYSTRSMATLKNLMQLKKLTFRKSHRSYYSQLPRIASFIGTSNQKELLTDTTGSRRFLCMEVKGKIDCTRPDYAQLYAQLKAELLAGERYWFTSEEEKEIQEHNRYFYRQSPETDIFFRCFRLPKEGEEAILLSPTEIFCRLQKKYPAAFRSSNVVNMGRLLVGLGVERVRTRHGSAYRVVPV